RSARPLRHRQGGKRGNRSALAERRGGSGKGEGESGGGSGGGPWSELLARHAGIPAAIRRTKLAGQLGAPDECRLESRHGRLEGGSTEKLNGARFPRGHRGFGAGRLAIDGTQSLYLVGDTHQEHRLARVLEEIDDAVGSVFQIDRLSVGEEMHIGG